MNYATVAMLINVSKFSSIKIFQRWASQVLLVEFPQIQDKYSKMSEGNLTVNDVNIS